MEKSGPDRDIGDVSDPTAGRTTSPSRSVRPGPVYTHRNIVYASQLAKLVVVLAGTEERW